MKTSSLFKATIAVGSTILAANSLCADDGTWNQTGGSTWHTTTNWTSNTIPGAGDVATLGNSITADAAVSIGSNNTTVGTLNFDSGFNYSITETAQRTLTFDSAVANSAQINVTTVNGAGSHLISNTRVNVVDNLTIDVVSDGSLTIAARISGISNRTITKTGDGILTLAPTTNSDYDGSVVLNAGTLSAEANKAFGDTTSVTVNGGTLNVRGSTAGTLTLGAAADLALSAGTITFDLGTGFDQIISSGAGVFTITGGALNLNLGSGFDYGDTYEILSGFGGTNSVSGLTFTGYDDVNYLASLGTDGVLEFSAIPESSSYALLAGLLALGSVMVRRRG
jgi:fibronectin-binding autotransporter adhesin